jgi:hypothetical protein
MWYFRKISADKLNTYVPNFISQKQADEIVKLFQIEE